MVKLNTTLRMRVGIGSLSIVSVFEIPQNRKLFHRKSDKFLIKLIKSNIIQNSFIYSEFNSIFTMRKIFLFQNVLEYRLISIKIVAVETISLENVGGRGKDFFIKS
jgi:hypothetical protein